MSISSELNKKDKSIQGRIRYHGGVLADLVRAAEELQTNVDNACAKAYQQGFDDGLKAEYKGPRSLTREEALELHYAMWNDMRKELGDKPSSLERINFKRRWISDRPYLKAIYGNINHDCFLCEYATQVYFSRGNKQVKDLAFGRCAYCPIEWNKDKTPEGCTNFFGDVTNPPCCGYALENGVDYRFDPISTILALPEKETKCHE